jgi:2,3-bisphosphoglycerate-independent phosphoglycerate mutase
MWYPGIEADAVETFDEDAAAHGMHGLLQGDQFINRFMALDFTHSINPEIF